MPRKQDVSFKIVPYATTVPGRKYRAKLCQFSKASAGQVRAEFELLHKSQQGRRVSLVLSKDFGPDSLGAKLLRACGAAVIVGSTVSGNQIVGKEVVLIFGTTLPEFPEIVDVQPATKEAKA